MYSRISIFSTFSLLVNLFSKNNIDENVAMIYELLYPATSQNESEMFSFINKEINESCYLLDYYMIYDFFP